MAEPQLDPSALEAATLNPLETWLCLGLLEVTGVGPKTASSVLRWVRSSAGEIGSSHDQLQAAISESKFSKYAPALAETSDRDLLVEILEKSRIQCLFMDAIGPEDAKRSTPPFLFAQGNVHLLTRPRIGFSGSRAATDKGLKIAHEVSESLTREGIVPISGGARGIDSTVHEAALRAGGSTIVVLAEGIAQGSKGRKHADNDSVLLVSEFYPRARWMSRRAMQRNRTIAALSSALIVVEAKNTGGSISAGRTALEMGLPVFVVEFGDERKEYDGNRILLHEGATPLRRRRSGDPNLDELLAVVATSNESSSLEAQANLF